MLRVFSKQFSTFSQVYAEAVAKKAIIKDACQLNVVQYLDRFQRVLESYQRPVIPNFEIIKIINGRQLSCGIYDTEEEAKIDLLFLGKTDKEQCDFYIKPYLEPTTISSSVQKRKTVTSTINQFPRLPTEVSRYRTYSQFKNTWKQPQATSEEPKQQKEADDVLTSNNHLTYKKLIQMTKDVESLPDRRGIMATPPRIPRGIYLFGDVGTGKSYLMDLFYKTCNVNGGKCRVHFHEFMQDFHRQLHEYKQQQIREEGREQHMRLTSEKDAIVQVSKKIALENMLICFDEFHVTDIADALILSHIFETFYKMGSVVFTTSNHSPDSLYMNGLNRLFFLPFIALISNHSRVIDIASKVDYRKSLAHPVNDVVITPSGPAANEVLYGMFPQLSPVNAKPFDLQLSQTRSIQIPAVEDGVCRIPFSRICQDDRGADDYEKIATAFHTVIITDVFLLLHNQQIPQFDVSDSNVLSRFVKMIDQFYDHRIRLIMTSAVSVPHLFDTVFEREKELAQKLTNKHDVDLMQKGRLSAMSALVFSCKRTLSRLIEMTSKDYLEQHAITHNYIVCLTIK